MSILGEGFPTSCEKRADGVVIHWWRTDDTVEPGAPCLCGEKRYQPPED